jgi:MinD superfamily P-loop ATPase
MMRAKWVPVVDASKCTGCGRCVEVCVVKCLEIAESIATLPRPGACGSEEHCITECRDDAIHMEWVPMERNEAVGVWR